MKSRRVRTPLRSYPARKWSPGRLGSPRPRGLPSCPPSSSPVVLRVAHPIAAQHNLCHVGTTRHLERALLRVHLMPLTCQETHTAYPTLLRQSFGIYILEFRDPDNSAGADRPLPLAVPATLGRARGSASESDLLWLTCPSGAQWSHGPGLAGSRRAAMIGRRSLPRFHRPVGSLADEPCILSFEINRLGKTSLPGAACGRDVCLWSAVWAVGLCWLSLTGNWGVSSSSPGRCGYARDPRADLLRP